MSFEKYCHGGGDTEGWMEQNDTPRTDAELEKPRDGVYSSFFSMASHAKQLERELAEAKQWLNERYKALSEADERAERAEAEVERLGGLLYETRSLLTEFFDCVDIGGLHDGDCNISTEDPEKWDLGCNCTTAEIRKKYIELYSK